MKSIAEISGRHALSVLAAAVLSLGVASVQILAPDDTVPRPESGNAAAAALRDGSKSVNQRRIWTINEFRALFGPEYDKRLAEMHLYGFTPCETAGDRPVRICEDTP